MFAAAEPLLLGSGDRAAIDYDCGSGIVKDGVDAQDTHVSPPRTSGRPPRAGVLPPATRRIKTPIGNLLLPLAADCSHPSVDIGGARRDSFPGEETQGSRSTGATKRRPANRIVQERSDGLGNRHRISRWNEDARAAILD